MQLNAKFFTAVLVSLPTLAQPASVAEPLAQRGSLTADARDLRALNAQLPETEFENLRRDRAKVLSSLDEILDLKSLKRLASIDKEAIKQDPMIDELALDFSVRRTHLSLLQSRKAQDAIQAIEADTATLDKRALEIYQTTDASQLRRDRTADFQHILFDLRRRPFAETSVRIQEAQRALADGVAFDEVVSRFSDEDRVKETQGKLKQIPLSAMDATLERTLFEDLKPGQHSVPIASRLGIHIVKLEQVHEPKRRPFEEVKSAIVRRILANANDEARRKVVADLRAQQTTFNEALLAKLVIEPSREALELARKKSLESVSPQPKR